MDLDNLKSRVSSPPPPDIAPPAPSGPVPNEASPRNLPGYLDGDNMVGLDDDDDYPFHRLLDELPDDFNHQYDFVYNFGEDLDHAVLDNPDDAIFDEDFGLPADDAMPEVDPPRFQIPRDGLDPEVLQEPGGNPNNEGGPGAICEAFQEHNGEVPRGLNDDGGKDVYMECQHVPPIKQPRLPSTAYPSTNLQAPSEKFGKHS
ncbi:hypothetical protein RhiJN_07863 [Ceratobasidium sp. AG-Ba]|nr:hypothetical protein RhiJN_07863 [Ceratobasidium sp. AG-Ba]